MNWLLRHPTFLLDAASDGAGGGSGAAAAPASPPAGDELPENLKDKYISLARHNGAIGAHSAKAKEAQKLAETAIGEREAIAAQLKELSSQADTWKAAATELESLKPKAAEAAQMALSQAQMNARLKTLLKHPEVLDESTLALVESSTLEPEALEAHLTKLAGIMSKAGSGRVIAPSPAKQESATPTPETFRDEALKAMSSGDMDAFNEGMSKYWAALDTKKKFGPAEPNLIGDQPAE
jgi:vacuolar-type H+-ATPase subunit E/Vma4